MWEFGLVACSPLEGVGCCPVPLPEHVTSTLEIRGGKVRVNIFYSVRLEEEGTHSFVNLHSKIDQLNLKIEQLVGQL